MTLLIMVFGTILSTALALLAAYIVSRFIVGASTKLLEGTQKIAAGNFNTKIELDTKDELGELADSFNTMVTDIRETNEALIQAKNEAQTANQAKSDFLANMSHEIRTPMAGVIGMADLVLESDLSPQQLDWVTSIKLSGEQLLLILNDILDQSKLEAGKVGH